MAKLEDERAQFCLEIKCPYLNRCDPLWGHDCSRNNGNKIRNFTWNGFVFTGRFREIHLRRMWIDDKRDLSLVNARLFLLE